MLCIYNVQAMTFLAFASSEALVSVLVLLNSRPRNETKCKTKLLETKTDIEAAANWPRDLTSLVAVYIVV